MQAETEDLDHSKLNVSLASSLLDHQYDQGQAAVSVGGKIWKTGIPVLDQELPDDLWVGGRVIGVGSLGSTSRSMYRIPVHLVATHLLEQHHARVAVHEGMRSGFEVDDHSQNVFIVSPPNEATQSIQRIYTVLSTRKSQSQRQSPRSAPQLERMPPQAETDPTDLLNAISLLQYLDLAGLLESLSEISSKINHPFHNKRTIILIQGLASSVTSLYRRSGLTQTASLLSTVLQTLRNISNVSAGSNLTLVEFDITWGSPYLSNSTASDLTHAAHFQSSFASTAGRELRVSGLNNNTLALLLPGGMDVIVAVHDADGKSTTGDQGQIVEVVKDERLCASRNIAQPSKGDGGSFGATKQNTFQTWCVWS